MDKHQPGRKKSTNKNANKKEQSFPWDRTFDALDDVVFILQEDFTIKKINQKGATLLEREKKDIKGQKCYELFHDTTTPPKNCPLCRSKKTRRTEYSEIYVEKWKSWFSLKSTPIINENGDIKDYVDLMRDITPQKIMQEEMAQSEEKHRLLYENAPLAYQSLDEEGCFLDVNPSWLTTLGYERADVIGKPFSSFLHPDWKQHFEKNFPEFKKKGSIHDVQFKLRHKDGHYIDVSFEGCIGYNMDGSFRQTYCVFKDISSTKKATEALEAREKRFRQIYENLSVGLARISLDNRILEANEAYAEMLGYDAKVLIGMHLKSFTMPDVLDENLENQARLIRGEIDHYRMEKHFIHKSGKTVYGILDANLVRDVNGHPDHLIGSVIDISGRKEMEKALKKSEERLQLAVKSAKIGLWDQDFVNGIITRNEEWAEMLGYKLREIENNLTALQNLVHPDDKAKLDENILEHERGKKSHFSIEHRLKTRDGKWKWVLNTGKIVERDKNGIPIRATGIHLDIHDQKITEEALRNSENMMRSIFRVAPTGIGVVINRIITEVNMMVCEMTGYSKEELLGKSARVFYPTEEDYNYVGKEKYKQIKEHGTGIVETRWQKKNGIIINIIMASTPIDPKDLSRGVTFTALDITKRKEYEEKLKRKNEEYLVLNKELQKSLKKIQEINVELEGAKNKAEESDRLKSAFLANMSHEIRTPMNGIIGFSEMLTRSTISDEKRAFYSKIVVENSKQLLSIVNDILDISLIESDTLQLMPDNFSINEMADEVFAFYMPQARNKGLDLHLRKGLNDNESYIYADKRRLRQVFDNLISNALKFTPKGKIEFGYRSKDDKLLFFVHDTGVGISKKYQQKIFDRFVQEDMESSRKFGGTGLGLAISKKLVELMKGEVGLESEKGKGTKFYFSIPYHPTKMEDKEKKGERINQDNYTILIAEDEDVNYLFLEEALKDEGLKILRAKNGLETLKMLRKNRKIGLVLLDIKMPEMDGYETVRKIKEEQPKLPVIAQTAYAMAKDKDKILSAGCDEYISKPIQLEELFQKINQFLPGKD